jgi:hypothetical protein
VILFIIGRAAEVLMMTHVSHPSQTLIPSHAWAGRKCMTKVRYVEHDRLATTIIANAWTRSATAPEGLRMFEQPSGEFTCASCAHFDAEKRYCTLRSFGTRGEIVACEVYDPRMKRSA